MSNSNGGDETPRQHKAHKVLDLDNDRQTPDGSRIRPIDRLCYLLLSEALLRGATEVVLDEPDTSLGTVEYFFGNAWHRVMSVPVNAHRVMVNQLKVMAGRYTACAAEQSAEIHLKFHDELRIVSISVSRQPQGNERVVLRLPVTTDV